MKKLMIALSLCVAMLLGCSSPTATQPTAEATATEAPASETSVEAPAATEPAVAEKITLKIGTCAPESSTFASNGKLFGEKLVELSGGTMDIELAAGGALGNVPQHFSQLNEGTLDMFIQGLDAPAAVSGGEDFNVLNVPFLFNDTAHFHAFVESDVFGGMMNKVRETNKFAFLGLIGDRPARSLSTNKHAVRTPDDLKDLLIRVSESAIPMAVWQAWGANTTTCAPSAIFEGLQTSQFDGQENGIEAMVVDGFMEVQSYYMMFDYTQQGIATFISDATVAKLSEEQMGWVKAALDYVLETTSKQLWETDVPGYYKTMEESGVEIVKDVDIAAFRAVVDGLIPTFEGQYFSAGLYGQIRELAEK